MVLAELKRHKGDDVVVCVVPSIIRGVLAGLLRGVEPAAVGELVEDGGGVDIVEV